MTSQELSMKMSNNANAQLIPKGTEFKVYDSKGEILGTVAIQRTTIVYLDMKIIPQDLLIGDYTFEEIIE